MSDHCLLIAGMARRRINEYEQAIEQWQVHSSGLESQIRQLRAQLKAKDDSLANLTSRLSDTELGLKIEMMHTAGLEAQREHLRSLGPDAPMAWQPSGKTFKDGQVKTKLRLVYEEAFDAKGRKELGIANPAEYRKH